MKKIIVLLIAFCAVPISCTKYQEIQDPLIPFVNPKEDIGKLHNEQLKLILENVEYIPKRENAKEYVVNIFNTNRTYDCKSEISLSNLPDFPKNIEDLDLDEWLTQFSISSSLKQEISKTFELFQESNNLSEILAAIAQKETAAESLFEGEDLELYFEHLAVAKYTSVFWYPESEGGLDGIQYLSSAILDKKSSQKFIYKVNWWKVLGVDCVGGMMGGPAGYAGASAISVIMQL